MTDVIRTPWNSEQVQALNGYQEHGTRPPRVCNSEGHASGISPVLDATHTGWICPDPACTYTQDWEWRSTLDYAAGIRDAARQASGQQPDNETVVAYRSIYAPDLLFCRAHKQDWPGFTPLTSDDLPDGGICTWGPNAGPKCGRDVLIDPPEPVPAAGLSDTQPTVDQARPPRVQWRVEGYDADEWNPLGLPEDDHETAVAKRASWKQRLPGVPTRLLRETTTWTVEEDETR
ncbi:hypothetical protein [Streptomyces sp. NPDC006477]|uniref:hypothetical protein n=1 Tax=Streptomyces sp. NPDC006477 TaxID=3364747 RepID=UPI00367A77A1